MKARYVFYATLIFSFFVTLPLPTYATVYLDNTSTDLSSGSIAIYSDGTYTSANESFAYHIAFTATTTIPITDIYIEDFTTSTYVNATTSGCDVDVDLCDFGVMYIWNTSTTTFSSDRDYVGIAWAEEETTNGGDQRTRFELLSRIYLVAGESYIFEFQPWNVNYLSNSGYYHMLGFGPYSANLGEFWLWREDTQAYSSYTGYPKNVQLILEDNFTVSSDAPIVIDTPCATDSFSYPCTYGLATTTESVTITGVSTLNQSTLLTYYGVVAKWISANGNVFDVTYTPIPTTETTATFETTVTRAYSREVAYLSEIQVCQVFDDVSLMSGFSYIDYNEDDCASIIIGSGLTTASTTALAGDLGWLDPVYNTDGNLTPKPTEIVNNGTTTFDSLVENVKTFGVFAFWLPTMYVIQDGLTEYYLTGSSSTSTDTTFDIPLDMSAFGLPTTTAHIPISAMLAKAEDLSPDFFTYIDYFLWGLFWLFILSRVLSGAWNVLPERNDTMSPDEYNRRKYSHLVANAQLNDARKLNKYGRYNPKRW